MLLEMPAHGILALIHRDRDDKKLRAIPELLLRRLHPRQQLGADGAPRRPELHDDRLLADPLRQRDRIAGETLECDGRRRLTDGDPNHVLSPKQRGRHEQHPRAQPTTHHARFHQTCPALTKEYSAMSSRTTPAALLIHTIHAPARGSAASAPEKNPTTTSRTDMPSENTNR